MKKNLWLFWLLALVGWSIVPYKIWTRAIIGTEGFNAGDIVLLIAVSVAMPIVVREYKSNILYFCLLLLWTMVCVSFLKGILAGENIREMLRVVRASLFWSIIPLMCHRISDKSTLQRWIRGMNIILMIASVSIVLFAFFPSFIPVGDEVGSLREDSYGGFNRIFTGAMWGVYAGSVIALGYIIINMKNRINAFLSLLVYSIGLIFTFIRTFYVGLIFATGYFIIKDWKNILRSTVIPGLILVSLLTIFGLPPAISNLVNASVDRFSGFLAVDFNNIDITDESGVGSLLWRISEFDATINNMSSVPDKVVGVMGRMYSLIGDYQNSVPHISYVGIYYCHGWFGVAVYLLLFVTITQRLWLRIKIADDPFYRWIFSSTFICWISFIIGALTSPLLQFPFGTTTLGFIVGLSESAFLIYQGTLNATDSIA